MHTKHTVSCTLDTFPQRMKLCQVWLDNVTTRYGTNHRCRHRRRVSVSPCATGSQPEQGAEEAGWTTRDQARAIQTRKACKVVVKVGVVSSGQAASTSMELPIRNASNCAGWLRVRSSSHGSRKHVLEWQIHCKKQSLLAQESFTNPMREQNQYRISIKNTFHTISQKVNMRFHFFTANHSATRAKQKERHTKILAKEMKSLTIEVGAVGDAPSRRHSRSPSTTHDGPWPYCEVREVARSQSRCVSSWRRFW